MKKAKITRLTSFDEHLDTTYGKQETSSRKNFEMAFEPFKLGIVMKEARIFKHLTQEAVALKSGTTKFYISRIENDASDIRLSTLMRIIYDGLGGKLKFLVDI